MSGKAFFILASAVAIFCAWLLGDSYGRMVATRNSYGATATFRYMLETNWHSMPEKDGYLLQYGTVTSNLVLETFWPNHMTVDMWPVRTEKRNIAQQTIPVFVETSSGGYMSTMYVLVTNETPVGEAVDIGILYTNHLYK